MQFFGTKDLYKSKEFLSLFQDKIGNYLEFTIILLDS